MKFKSIFTLLPLVFLFTLCNTAQEKKPKIKAIKSEHRLAKGNTFFKPSIDSTSFHYDSHGNLKNISMYLFDKDSNQWNFLLTTNKGNLTSQASATLIGAIYHAREKYDSIFQTIEDTIIIVFDSKDQISEHNNLKLFYKDNLIIKERMESYSFVNDSQQVKTIEERYYNYTFDQYRNWIQRVGEYNLYKERTITDRTIYYE